jgi:hypothetical protein
LIGQLVAWLQRELLAAGPCEKGVQTLGWDFGGEHVNAAIDEDGEAALTMVPY